MRAYFSDFVPFIQHIAGILQAIARHFASNRPSFYNTIGAPCTTSLKYHNK